MIIDSKEKPKRDSKSRRDSSSSDSSSDSDSDSSHGGHDHKDYANYGPPPSYRATDAPMPAPYMDSAVQGPYLGQSSSTIRDVGTSSVPPANGIGWSTHRDPIPGLYLGPSSSTIRDVGTSTVPPTNGIVLSTRRDPINGTWFLDPLLSPHPSLLDRKEQKHHKRRRRGATGPPSATIESRRGHVNVAIAIVGAQLPARAPIVASTRHGNIKLDIFGKAPAKSVELDVSSRHGHITVLVPRSFSGMLELHTRRGRVHTMPSLSGAAQVVRASGDKVVLIVGQGAQMGASTPQIADYGKISSRSGNVTIGFSGEDDVSTSKPQGLVQEMLQRIVR